MEEAIDPALQVFVDDQLGSTPSSLRQAQGLDQGGEAPSPEAQAGDQLGRRRGLLHQLSLRIELADLADPLDEYAFPLDGDMARVQSRKGPSPQPLSRRVELGPESARRLTAGLQQVENQVQVSALVQSEVGTIQGTGLQAGKGVGCVLPASQGSPAAVEALDSARSDPGGEDHPAVAYGQAGGMEVSSLPAHLPRAHEQVDSTLHRGTGESLKVLTGPEMTQDPEAVDDTRPQPRDNQGSVLDLGDRVGPDPGIVLEVLHLVVRESPLPDPAPTQVCRGGGTVETHLQRRRSGAVRGWSTSVDTARTGPQKADDDSSPGSSHTRETSPTRGLCQEGLNGG